MSVRRPHDHVYLSPHFDDAAFSCGGLIHGQSRSGSRVLVVTVFAAPPDPGEPLSSLARRLHEKMGDPRDPIAVRQGEDRDALAVLGAEPRWLSFRGCTYRSADERWLYPSPRDVFGELRVEDRGLDRSIVEELVDELGDPPYPRIYAPLGIGHHVDHQWTHRAGALLLERGFPVAFYEDCPYASDTHEMSFLDAKPYPLSEAETAMRDRGAVAGLVPLSAADLEAHIDSTHAYVSQLDGASREVIASSVRDFFLRHDPDRPMIRLWYPPGVPEDPAGETDTG